jgi:putative phosphoesterase
MKIALFSDVHGNLDALDAVLADIPRHHCEAAFCLGDLVGYAPFPNEVIDRLRETGIPSVMGNYDDAVGYDRDDCGCGYREESARKLGDQSLSWTKAHTTADSKHFLRELAPQIRFEADGRRVLLVHGSPRRINEYLFEDRPLSSFRHIAEAADADVIAFGHTHKPYVKRVDDVLFVNTGAVGRPKDGDPRACYVVVDLATLDAQLARVPYAVARVAEAIRASELPDAFAVDIETAGSTPVGTR